MGPLRLLALFAGLATLAACGGRRDDDRVAQYASRTLGVPAGGVRVTSATELTTEDHAFYLVTAGAGKSLVVVVPDKGEPFDARATDAFERVARAEHATENLSQIGPERVAGWFGVLGGGACPPPPVDQAHFAEVMHLSDGGVELSYVAARRTCAIDLRPDGSLAGARSSAAHGPSASAPGWRKPPARE